MTKVRYEIEVDADMFPYPPGSEVVVRKSDSSEWVKSVFQCARPVRAALPYLCGYEAFDECRPLSTHGHLLGTHYPDDTPACAKCGKAHPDCACVKEVKFEPFQRVLVRDNDNDEWRASFFSHIDEDGFVCCGGWWVHCIPYEGNERLLGTTDTPNAI